MPNRFRDVITTPLTVDYFHQHFAQGWVITAVEWARPAEADAPVEAPEERTEAPFGQRISEDCSQLVEHPREMEVLSFIYEGVIAGVRPGRIADELNGKTYRTRRGAPWTATDVFQLMPRIIEVSPRLQRRPDWPSQRAQLQVIA